LNSREKLEELNAMETVSIRNLRGEVLRENALKGKPLAITNRGALIGVVIPVAAAWVEHLIDYNWSHVRQSITEGEQAMGAGAPMVTIQDVVPGGDAADYQASPQRGTPERLALPLVAAMAGGAVAQASGTEEALERLRLALNPAAGQDTSPHGPSVITVRIGDLTARLIEKAGADGQTLAVTHDRELIGIIIPVTRGLVEFLIEQNLSRILYNIGLGEKQIMAPGKLTTLGETLSQADAGEAASQRPLAPSTLRPGSSHGQ
jgi:hypothetical protein